MQGRKPSRRDIIKTAAILVGGGATMVVLPGKWTKPIIESVVAPAHAFSFPNCFINPYQAGCPTGGGGGGGGS